MNYLGRLFSSAQDYYRCINGANLTGAIDVIVIEKENGEYVSTPFYVRFGKMGILYPRGQLVEIDVNGQTIPDLHMRVGRTGFAYFRGQDEDYCAHNSAKTNSPAFEEDGAVGKVGSETSDDIFDLELNEDDKILLPNRGALPSDVHADQPSITLSTCGNGKEQNTVSLKSFVNYLQQLDNWPNEFYIYQLIPQSDGNQRSSTTKRVHIDASKQCQLLFPDELKYLDDTQSFDSIWVIWSGKCMTGQTAANCLIGSITEYERQVLLEKDAQCPNYNIIINQYKLDQGVTCKSDQAFHQQSTNRRSWFGWGSSKPKQTLSPTDQTATPNLRVQPLLAPISLDVASPIYSSEENIHINDKVCHSPTDPSNTDLINVNVPTAPLYASTHNLSTSPDAQQGSSPDEAGYFSDETGNKTTYKKHSTQLECVAAQEICHLTSEQLQHLNLNHGTNEAVFTVVSKYQGTCQCACFIYLWSWSDKIVISDIDGTITRSDWLGQLMPLVGVDWTHSHIAQIYDRIAHNGYRFIYLSSRPIGQARVTRRFLHAIQQADYRLPDGPILLSPFSVLEAFHKEVILRRADEYKIQCLQQVYDLFTDFQAKYYNTESHPFVAGFGNRPSDVITYKAVGLQDHQIFTVNYLGCVICGDPSDELMKTKESQKQKSSNTVDSSFDARSNKLVKMSLDTLLQIVDDYFPQTRDKLPHAANYSDYTFWRN